MARLDFDKLNSEIRYLMFSVFQVEPGVLGDDREAAVKDARLFFEGLEDKGVVVRGIYDVAGLRADADFMIWTHAATIEELQAAYADFRRTTVLGQASAPIWSNSAVHRPAEFNKSHVPSFIAGEDPGDYICVYPFVRSYECTCSPTRSVARCSPITVWLLVRTRTFAPTRSRPSPWGTTSGFSRSKHPSSFVSSI
ncbi:hypothetical protein G9444_6756 (plasmid) [Rhodococcus erythropolis]|uniref:Coproheme decarboxylase n=1 Tax=Rhodococcus erythropolis TaxID=1833 RepID=A0A6G9D491_RHOER|nr:hypothetical protein G9444_6756 [Rhodococcus erythropolis]